MALSSVPSDQRNKYFAWARVLLGIAALACELAFASTVSIPFTAGAAAFTTYALVLTGRSPQEGSRFALLALFIDTVFFLVLAGIGSVPVMWVAAAFYLFLIFEAVTGCAPREVLFVAAICVAFCAIPHGPAPWLASTAAGTGAMALAYSFSKARLKREIDALGTALSDAQQRAGKARESERQRIANDFHDGPLQSYMSLQMRLEVVKKMFERDFASGMAELQQLQELARAQVQDLRAFVRSMRPTEVDGNTFFSAARRVADLFQKESGVPVTFVGAETRLPLSQDATTEVLNMLREALHNVQKHAGASRVAVSLEVTPDLLELAVDDNGRGFHFSGRYTLEELEMLHLGPASLMRRARSLNAGLTLESTPGRGASIKARIPLR